MAPDRRPEHEGHARPARAEVGGRERDASGEPRDDGAEAARRGESRHGPLRRPERRERRDPAAVAQLAADEREDDVLALVQGLERADAEGRGVVGDEQDRPRVAHRSASS